VSIIGIMNVTIRVSLLSLWILMGVIGVGGSSMAQAVGRGGTSVAAVEKLGWKLVWRDEFTGTQLNAHHWTRCKRGKADWQNTMSDQPSLLKVYGGVLHLRGVKNKSKSKDASPYLTAGVHSNGKVRMRFGKVQIRARFKSAKGAWPALWMLGEKRGWPANGEIDLMEHLNFEKKIYQTVHSEYTQKIGKINRPKKGTVVAIQRDGWNTYGIEWDAKKVVFTVNGKKTHTYPRMAKKGAKQYPFNQPFYFLLTMQIGGNWVGKTNPAHYPAEMKIDWIRVYKKK